MKRTTITASLAAAALVVGATGAVAALDQGHHCPADPLQRLVCETTGHISIDQGPYYVEHDIEPNPQIGGGGASADLHVRLEVYETDTDNRVAGTDQSTGRIGADTNPGDLLPDTFSDPNSGTTVTTVDVPGEIVCVQPIICTPGVNREVKSGDFGARAFDSSGEDAVSVHHSTGSSGADPGEVCVRTTGCGTSGGPDNFASVDSPSVTINE